ncbi:MAG: ribonuclease P protein component [Burkholderiales bacterium]|nr:ribonuclease P protein component [Burkholderiales bacterium]
MGLLKRTADFERVLAVRPRSRSTHFAVHHVAARLSPPAWRARSAAAAAHPSKLSTDHPPVDAQAVDELPSACWLGTVVPKRHARRAVTRSLLKRQIRSVADALGDGLAPGLWVVRLTAPFERARFPSAASEALRDAARAELMQLLQRVVSAPTARPA